MNCANHVDVPAVAFCRACGKALCNACERTVQGTVFCDEHVLGQAGQSAAAAGASPYASPYTSPTPLPTPNLAVSPGLAFVLGLLPGVGAIYNGQYAKGLIHALVFGLLISITAHGGGEGSEVIFGVMIFAWYCYMAFEAYHTAKKRQLGEPVDEFSSILPLRGGHGFPVAPVVLILLGVLFLLNNLDLLRFRDVLRFWPLFLIGLGVYLLWVRISAARSDTIREAANER